MMIVVEERNTQTGKSRYKVVSAPIDDGLPLPAIGTELDGTWRSRRGAQRACDKANVRGGWRQVDE